MAQKKGAGFQSGAGLIRYFDSEDDKAPKIDPRVLFGVIIGAVIVIEFVKWYWPAS